MPVMNYYIVEQTRRVEVRAINASDAAKLAAVAFEYGQAADGAILINNESAQEIHGIQGNTTSKIREVSLNVSVAAQ